MAWCLVKHRIRLHALVFSLAQGLYFCLYHSDVRQYLHCMRFEVFTVV